jgi:hypothetical protein
VDRTPAALVPAVAARALAVALALDEDSRVAAWVVAGALKAVSIQYADQGAKTGISDLHH